MTTADERIQNAREEASKLLRMLDRPEPGIAMWWVALGECFDRVHRAIIDGWSPSNNSKHFEDYARACALPELVDYLALLRGNSIFILEMKLNGKTLDVQTKFMGDDRKLSRELMVATLRMALMDAARQKWLL